MVDWDDYYAEDTGIKRVFATGATRDTAEEKLEYAGFLSPTVLHRFAEYMHVNRHMRDGSLRASDNWQKGIPLDVYEQSLWRHFMDFWALHRGQKQCAVEKDMQVVLSALMFNIMGYLHEVLKAENKFLSETRADPPRDVPETVPDVACTSMNGHAAHIWRKDEASPYAFCGGYPDAAPAGAVGVDVLDKAALDPVQNPHTLMWQSDINRG